ncbi:protein mono-ADP-ribosyltransferase PARP14 isoform X2 [Xenopus laevis]|uniref:Poly [ADP-ribose] polymerase n=1 Tax=Xenopus laevis TaxID=8355 RepID=A0A8J1KM58_XENLA|nr:protein mono-ADP-ribosyltransferase PARP14 isoform X2 [Xenopus laevis]
MAAWNEFLDNKPLELRSCGDTIELTIRVEEHQEEDNMALPCTVQCSGAGQNSANNALNVSTQSNVTSETVQMAPNVTQTSIPLESDSQYFVVRDSIIYAVKNNFPGLNIQVTPWELKISGGPRDLVQARREIKTAIDGVKFRTIALQCNIKDFLSCWDKKALSEKIFGRTQEGCVILDSSRGLRLYAPCITLLDQAENLLKGIFQERSIYIKNEDRNVIVSESWTSLTEKIQSNKNILLCSHENENGSLNLSLQGFKKDVETATEIIKDHLRLHITTQEDLNLESRILVENLDDLMLSFNLGELETGVRSLPSSGTSVTLIGPENAVTKSMELLRNVKQIICHEFLSLGEHGALYFFKNQGKEMLDQISKDHNCKVYIGESKEACSKKESRGRKCDLRTLPPKKEKSAEWQQSTAGYTMPVNSTDNKQPLIQLILSYGNLEEKQANVISAPLLAANPRLNVLNVTNSLQTKAGTKFSTLFTTILNDRPTLMPGSLVEMPLAKNTHALNCDSMLFIVCTPYDEPHGSSVKDLRKGISDMLKKCSQKKMCSVAMPTIGAGIALRFPNEIAARIFGEELKLFVEKEPNTSLKKIQLVFQKNMQCLFAAYEETLLQMDFGGRIVLCNEDGDPLKKLTLGQHIDLRAGKLSVSVVYGDIVEENNDVIANSTNFNHWGPKTVAHSIFTAAGPEVITDTQRCHSSNQKVVVTGSGSLNCKYIFHCDCQSSLLNIEHIVREVLLKCEESGLQSVSMPAFGTGVCRFDPETVAKYMANSISSVVQSSNLSSLTSVRLVALKPYIYRIFSVIFQKYFKPAQEATRKSLDLLTARLKCRQVQNTKQIKYNGIHEIPIPHHPIALLSIVGTDPKTLKTVKSILESEFFNHYWEEEIEDALLKSMSEDEIQSLFSLLKEKPQVQVILNQGRGCIHINGCDANIPELSVQVKNKLKDILHARQEDAQRDKAGLLIQWSYCNGASVTPFEEETCQQLEKKFTSDCKGTLTVDFDNRTQINVNLETMKALIPNLGQEVTVVRKDLESETDLPDHWDQMNGHALMMVPLDPNSEEYCKVHADFTRTAGHCCIVKIERVQNIYQYIAYALSKKIMKEKNGTAKVNECTLYYGTASKNCQSINYNGFDRNFDLNATTYGDGVYFSVDASYSAGIKFSPQDPETQLRYIYQVKVLAGHHTKGRRGMKAPPCKSPSAPFDLYDSLTDNNDDPTMFVVFHDDQVYPEYLISFR